MFGLKRVSLFFFLTLYLCIKCEEQSFGHQQRLDDILNEVQHDGIDLSSINQEDQDVNQERVDSTSSQALGDDERVSFFDLFFANFID